MSRVILTRWPRGEERVVVGWDHPAGGCFYQEFNEEPEDGTFPDDWEEVLRYGGYIPDGIPLAEFQEALPDDLRPLVTYEVMRLLEFHSQDPDSGFKPPIDLSRREGT